MRYMEFKVPEALKKFVRYIWLFEKMAEEKIFSRDTFLPDTRSYLVLPLFGRYTVNGESAEGHNSKEPLYYTTDSEQSDFPRPFSFACGCIQKKKDCTLSGNCRTIGVCLEPGGASGLGLFEPAFIRGIGQPRIPWTGSFCRGCEIASKEEFSRVDLDFLTRELLGRLTGSNVSDDWEEIAVLARRHRYQLSVNEWSKRCDCNTRFLERLCLRRTGYSPRDYCAISLCGIARSVLYLKPNVNLAALSQSLGFYDQAHFTRVFSRWTGFRPREFANLCLPFRKAMEGAQATRGFLYPCKAVLEELG